MAILPVSALAEMTQQADARRRQGWVPLYVTRKKNHAKAQFPEFMEQART